MIEDETIPDEYLTAAEILALIHLDSRQFGFLKLNDAENAKKKAVVQKAIRCLEATLLQHETKNDADAPKSGARDTKPADIKQCQLMPSTDTANNTTSTYATATVSTHDSLLKPSCLQLQQGQQQQEMMEVQPVIKTEQQSELSSTVSTATSSGYMELADVKPDRQLLDRQLKSAVSAVQLSCDPEPLAGMGDGGRSRDQAIDSMETSDTVEMMEVDSGEVSRDTDTIAAAADGADERRINPRVYCILGHFWLLLEKFDKALSAYQKYKRVCAVHWKDAAFLYGYGLTLLHFNAIKKACRVLLCVLFADPAFSCANEVHLRLALIYKARREFLLSRKRFQLVLSDTAICSLSRQQIDFHIAHLYEVCDRISSARDRYESLLSPLPTTTTTSSPSTSTTSPLSTSTTTTTNPPPPSQTPPVNTTDSSSSSLLLREHVCRQLSWLLHRERRQLAAIQLLQRALETAPRSPQTLYLLGRCHSSLGKVHEAFQAYKQSVVFSEASADTWCSIGVLYQQHSQCMDALQAYVSAVQLDKHHSAAWSNLAVLFESASQPRDALACYVNALGKSALLDHVLPPLSSPPPSPSGDTHCVESNQLIRQRIKLLKQQLATPPYNCSAAHYNRPSRLPSIEEAWNKNTTTEMTRESQKLQTSNMQNKQRVFGMMSNAPHPPPPYPGSVLPVNGIPTVAKRLKTEDGEYRVLSTAGYHSTSVPVNQQHYRQQQQQQQQLISPASAVVPSAPPSAVSETDVEAMTTQLLTRKDLAASLAEDLIRQFAQSGEIGLEELATVDAALSGASSMPPSAARATRPPALSVDDLRPLSASTANSLHRRNDDVSASSDLAASVNISAVSNDVKPSVSPSRPLPSSTTSSPPLSSSASDDNKQPQCRLHLNLTADELACVARAADWRRVSNPVLLAPGAPPPLPAAPPKNRLRRDQLMQQTPSVFVENKREAYSPNLFDFCLKNPIAVVRGMAAALKLDLGLFSTKTLVEANADHPVEIRTQVCQSSDENWDSTFTRRVWGCLSSRSHTTVAKYAQYQAASFTDSLRDEQDSKQPTVPLAAVHRDCDSDSRDSFSKYQRTGHRRGHKTIRFGTNVDLSDETKWRSQLLELNKLPPFCRVVSACNMLSHVGHPILGMNTVQLYMKVPGSRTPGHQENNNFCALNINIGPGDCEWFGVPASYWSAVNSLCERNGVSYLHGSWWPDMDELLDHGVPVYRFMQRPGDLVWVNVGCVHWVQSAGWCNNIAWNVGPLTGRQHCMAIERFEWNKLQRYKSIVPMQHLTWNLARNIRPTERLLFESVKTALMKSLEQVVMALEFVKECGVDIKFHGRQKDESSHYCGVCDVEVFNILMVKLHERKHVVHCIDCARRHNAALSGFVCLEEFKLDELFSVYDSFQLASVQPAASTTASAVTASATVSCATQQQQFRAADDINNTAFTSAVSRPTTTAAAVTAPSTTTTSVVVQKTSSGGNVSTVGLATPATTTVPAQVVS